MASLQIDPSTKLVTLATASSARRNSSVLLQAGAAGSSPYLNLRDEATDVAAFLCYDSVNVNTSVANYLCVSTFGSGFTASLVAAFAISSTLSTTTTINNNTDVAVRFPQLVGNTTDRTSKLRKLSCISEVFSDPSIIVDSAGFSSSCSLCDVEAQSPCPSLAQITCSAPANIERVSPYAPLLVTSPPQWANATIAFNSQFSPPPAWVPQTLCNAAGGNSSSGNVYTAVLAAGYGVVGNDVTGYTSGLDAMEFGPMQFSLSCSASSTSNEVEQGCSITPSVNASATASASAVNMSRAMIVGCFVANRGTPPLLRPSLARSSESCRFALTASTSVDVEVASVTQLGALQLESTTALLASSSEVDMYLAAWCPSVPASSEAAAASLRRHRVCTADAFWGDMVTPLCRDAGFDGGSVQPRLSAVQLLTADAPSNASGNLSSTLLQLRCPSTYFPTQQIKEDFDSCDMTWVPRASVVSAASAVATCTARYVRCYVVAEQQQERIEWVAGSVLFCAVFVGSMVVSTCSLWNERNELSNANSATLQRKRSTRLRTRSSKPSDTTSVAMLGLSSADVTNLVLGDSQRNASLHKKRANSMTLEEGRAKSALSKGSSSGGSSDGASAAGFGNNSIRDGDFFVPPVKAEPSAAPSHQQPLRPSLSRGVGADIEL
jgi:hypothetical protein